ncbi:MAG TPA: tRNA (N6-isopentenyl adenosine(37)-C2)-methylthiotransferase MiaB, partial [Burkholderiales bacterium]|nr:tRNA (N6-isopentenyl adenosine(37)-C2)-methylthiotransferase MiaB [Burkholderiales bacterium]
MAKKLYIKTFGCQMNEYDSEKITDLLHATQGLETTPEPEQADVILVNTCSVREKAQDKVFHYLGRWKHLKQRNRDLLIAVG